MLVIFCLFFVCCFSFSCPGEENIRKAFSNDGFANTTCVSFQGALGCVSFSNATNLRTGKNKKSFFLCGSPYESGRLIAKLAYDDLLVVTTEFLRKIPLALIAENWISKHDGPIVEVP